MKQGRNFPVKSKNGVRQSYISDEFHSFYLFTNQERFHFGFPRTILSIEYFKY
jgi:hypothetical protein